MVNMNPLIDTHAHLNFPDYKNDLDKVIKRAIKADVKKIICVSSNIGDSQKAIEIAKKYPGVIFAAVGIHPQQTDPENKNSLINQIKELATLASKNKVVAIGECGLDYSPAPPPEKDRSKADQVYLFKEQIKLAQKLNLPLLIHSRKAFDDTLKVLAEYKNIQGVFHCYAGGKKGIVKVDRLGFSARGGPVSGWYFGLDGNLTYDIGFQNVAALISLEKIILETDAPFLSPIPFRGKRNEPANIKIIAELLSKIKTVSFEEIGEITTKNAKKLFKI